jgi:hypothetical protein
MNILKRLAAVIGAIIFGAVTLANIASNTLGLVQFAADPKAKMSEAQQALAWVLSTPWWVPAVLMAMCAAWLMYITRPLPESAPQNPQQASLPAAPAAPVAATPKAAVRNYFPADKTRLGELLAEISEQLNNKGLQIARAPWLRIIRTDRDDSQLRQLISEIDVTRALLEDLAKEIWTNTILQNQKYEKELRCRRWIGRRSPSLKS